MTDASEKILSYDDSRELISLFNNWLVGYESKNSIITSDYMEKTIQYDIKHNIKFHILKNGIVSNMKDYRFDVTVIEEEFENATELLAKSFFCSTTCPEHIKIYLSLKYGFHGEY